MEEATSKPTPAIHHDELNVLLAGDRSGAEKAKVLIELLERGVFTAGLQFESDDDDGFGSVDGSEVDDDDIGLAVEYPSPPTKFAGGSRSFPHRSFSEFVSSHDEDENEDESGINDQESIQERPRLSLSLGQDEAVQQPSSSEQQHTQDIATPQPEAPGADAYRSYPNANRIDFCATDFASPEEHHGGLLSDFDFDSFLNCQSTAVSPPDSSRSSIDVFQFEVSDDEFSTPVNGSALARPLAPHIVTVDRESQFEAESEEEHEHARLSRRDDFELEPQFARARRVSYSVDSRPTAEPTERPDRQPVCGPVQEEANRAYRERALQSREAEETLRSLDEEDELSVVGKWDQKDEEPVIQIATPPEMERVKKKSKYDGPNADVRIDNIILPRDLPRYTMPAELTGMKPVFKTRDPSAERERPVINCVLPTPRQSPSLEAQHGRESRLEDTAESRPTDSELLTESALSRLRRSHPKKFTWGAILDAMAGAAATSTTSSDPKLDTQVAAEDHLHETSSLRDQLESQGGYDAKNPGLSTKMQGTFADDAEFAATLAAGLQSSGFDPDEVIDDRTFQRRDPFHHSAESPYKSPNSKAVADLGIEPKLSIPDINKSLVEDDPDDEWEVTSKKSKKGKKGKKKKGSAVAIEPSIPDASGGALGDTVDWDMDIEPPRKKVGSTGKVEKKAKGKSGIFPEEDAQDSGAVEEPIVALTPSDLVMTAGSIDAEGPWEPSIPCTSPAVILLPSDACEDAWVAPRKKGKKDKKRKGKSSMIWEEAEPTGEPIPIEATRSPSETAVPVQFRIPGKSGPTITAQAAPDADSGTRPQRPMSWDNSKEIKPLYLLEKTDTSSLGVEANPATLPELPPSEADSPVQSVLQERNSSRGWTPQEVEEDLPALSPLPLSEADSPVQSVLQERNSTGGWTPQEVEKNLPGHPRVLVDSPMQAILQERNSSEGWMPQEVKEDVWPKATSDDGDRTDQRIPIIVAPKEPSHPQHENTSPRNEEPTQRIMNSEPYHRRMWFGGLSAWMRNHSPKFPRRLFKSKNKKPEHLAVSAPQRELPAPFQSQESQLGIPEVQFHPFVSFAANHHIAQPAGLESTGPLPLLRKVDPGPTIEVTTEITTIIKSSTTVINPPSSSPFEILLRTKIFSSRIELSTFLCEPTWTPPNTGARCLIPKPEALQLHKLPPRETFAAKMIEENRGVLKEVEFGGGINISGVGVEMNTKGLLAALQRLKPPQWMVIWLSSQRDLYVCKHLLHMRDDESVMEKLHSIEDELMSIEKYQHGASEYMTVITYNDAMHSGTVTLLEALFDEHHTLATLNLVARVKDMPKKICQILCKEGKPSRYELKRSGGKVICRVDGGLPQPRPAAVSGEQEWRNIGGGWRRALHLILHDDSMSSPKEGLVATVPQMLALLHLRLRLIDCVPSTPIFSFEPPLSGNTGDSNVSVRRGIKLLGPPSGASHVVHAGTITVLFSGESSWAREELFWA